MSAGFTPGPWVVEDPFDFEMSVVANGDKAPDDWTFIAGCKWPDEDDHDITSREVQANASLIAAAPELYDALAGLLSRIDNHFAPSFGDDSDWAEQAQARAILAKARGEQVSA